MDGAAWCQSYQCTLSSGGCYLPKRAFQSLKSWPSASGLTEQIHTSLLPSVFLCFGNVAHLHWRLKKHTVCVYIYVCMYIDRYITPGTPGTMVVYPILTGTAPPSREVAFRKSGVEVWIAIYLGWFERKRNEFSHENGDNKLKLGRPQMKSFEHSHEHVFDDPVATPTGW